MPEDAEYLEGSYQIQSDLIDDGKFEDGSANFAWFHAEMGLNVIDIAVPHKWVNEQAVDLSALTVEESEELFRTALKLNPKE